MNALPKQYRRGWYPTYNQSTQNHIQKTTKQNYKKNMDRINSLTTESEEYEVRKKTSELCYGNSPPSPPPVKEGDTIYIRPVLNGTITKYIGTVVSIQRQKADIMWTSYIRNGIEIKREGTTLQNQKELFGWPGIKPTRWKDDNGKLIPVSVNLESIKVLKSCEEVSSACKMTCRQYIRSLWFKYPKPRDCIVSEWSPWSSCSKTCGGGTKTRTRGILNKAKNEGKPCPSVLKQERKCNIHACLDFTLARK